MKDVEYTLVELGKSVERRKGKVVVDASVEVRAGALKPFRMTLLPENRVDAAIGRLFHMGVIESFDDVLGVVDCGSCLEIELRKRDGALSPVVSDLVVGVEELLLCMRRLSESTELWKATGGVHSAALFDSRGALLVRADDIGKGNAIDAVIGRGLKMGLDFSGCVLASTGRQIGFMIEKAVRAGVPVVVSRGAPIYSSIEVARRFGVTLVCFARGRRMNIYTSPERVIGGKTGA